MFESSLQKQPEVFNPEETTEMIEETTQAQEEIINVLSNANNKINLQESFKKFRRQRNDNCKSHVALKNKRMSCRNSQEFQDALRVKFVETAKKYLGVPYAKRHLTPDHPNYNAPLFLDCCGLVRRVMQDLKEDFGFNIGGWNQAYQFDTLPKEVKLEDMKPGDLVFYSGTYFNPKKRKQKHDMVHVEIFLGGPTGEQTIAARYNKSVVKIFDSYKFESKTYYDIKFYFRSIDTWLQGICKSFCDEHLWLEDRDFYDSGKFSVFGEESDGEEGDGETGVDEKAQVQEKGKTKKTKAVQRVFIGKGNNDRLVKEYFTKENYQVLGQKLSFSDRYDIKWVQTTGEVDYLKFKEGSQIVNHIPNINVLTSKNGLLQTLKSYETSTESGLKLENFMPETYRLDVLEDEIKFANSNSTGLWISKPYHTNQGKNVKIISDITKFKKSFLNTKRATLGKSLFHELFDSESVRELLKEEEGEEEKENYSEKIDTRVVVQKYIENPLLLEGRKFDIRCYILICTMKPMFVLFHHGYCRLCISEYSLETNEKNQLNQLSHLTNNSIQKKHADYKTLKEDSIWTMPKFEQYLKEKKSVTEGQIKQIYDGIKTILTHCVKSAEGVLEKKIGYFQLLGCDVLIDENLKPSLIEINNNPAIFTDIAAHKEVIPSVVFKTLDLVTQLNERQNELEQILKNPQENLELGGFEVLRNQTTDFIFH